MSAAESPRCLIYILFIYLFSSLWSLNKLPLDTAACSNCSECTTVIALYNFQKALLGLLEGGKKKNHLFSSKLAIEQQLSPSNAWLSSALLRQVKDATSEATISKQLSPSTEVFSGHMRLAGVKYSQILENTESKDFKNLAGTLQETVSSDTSPRFSFFFSVIFLDCCDLLWTDRPFRHRLACQLFTIENAPWC